MVNVAGGAGAGNLVIKGRLDSSGIESGFKRVSNSFRDVKGQAESFKSDLTRMAQSASRLSKILAGLAITGATAMVAIASKAPAVSPALAQMQIQFGRISRSLGEALAPAFERVAVWMAKFANLIDENKDKIGDAANKILDFAEKIGKVLLPYLEKIAVWAIENPGLFAGIVAGLALGPKILLGIASISGLVKTLAGATIAASVLKALGLVAAIGGASWGIHKGLEALDNFMLNKSGVGEYPEPIRQLWSEKGMGLKRMPEVLLESFTGWLSSYGLDKHPNQLSLLDKGIMAIGRQVPQYTPTWKTLDVGTPEYWKYREQIESRQDSIGAVMYAQDDRKWGILNLIHLYSS